MGAAKQSNYGVLAFTDYLRNLIDLWINLQNQANALRAPGNLDRLTTDLRSSWRG